MLDYNDISDLKSHNLLVRTFYLDNSTNNVSHSFITTRGS